MHGLGGVLHLQGWLPIEPEERPPIRKPPVWYMALENLPKSAHPLIHWSKIGCTTFAHADSEHPVHSMAAKASMGCAMCNRNRSTTKRKGHRKGGLVV
jgi:hypothetical protein